MSKSRQRQIEIQEQAAIARRRKWRNGMVATATVVALLLTVGALARWSTVAGVFAPTPIWPRPRRRRF